MKDVYNSEEKEGCTIQPPQVLTASKLPGEIALTVAFVLHMKKKKMILMKTKLFLKCRAP